MNCKCKKTVAQISLILFVNFILLIYYPAQAHAQERLIITGFAIKTPAFKPYRGQGEFSFFLNRNASVNIELLDKDFNLVRSIELIADKKEGENIIAWDGKDEQGRFIKSGEYILSVAAMAENGTSAVISKEVEIEFEAPMGTEFKPHITEIEGKNKKEYPTEIPTKTVIEKDTPGCCIVATPVLFVVAIPIAWFASLMNVMKGNYEEAKNYFMKPFKKETYFLQTVPDHETYDEIKQEIDEYNDEIDVELAQKNKEIYQHNEQVKDSIVIRMKVAD